ncbi:alpha-galactosidase [bacterium]|nr:alpha-galactosidase [bacterium]
MTTEGEPLRFVDSQGVATVFRQAPGRLWLSCLVGEPCGADSPDRGTDRTRGPLVLSTSLGRFEAAGLHPQQVDVQPDHLDLHWVTSDGNLRVENEWQFCRTTGVVRRQDRLVNQSPGPVTVYRCQARFCFAPGRYEVYRQDGRWCRENQGEWSPLSAGWIELRHEWGRTTEGGTPYLCLRPQGEQRGVVFHLLPRGNWTIRAGTAGLAGERPFAVVELGLADEDLHCVLAAGESLALPVVLMQPLPSGEPHRAAPGLHRYVNREILPGTKREAPVVYNTWFDQSDQLEVPRLRRQLQAAQRVGCDVFVVDAGWYGPDGPDWAQQTGDWREKTTGAFQGRLREFTDEVRAAGLGFGLWMEPERIGPRAPIRTEHPDWLVEVADGMARLNLEDERAAAYLRGEMKRLIDTYSLAWMKIDFNFSLGPEGTGAELTRYYAAWYRLLDSLRAEYPTVFFEGCASGGLRHDLETLRHVDGHFLSDTVNPIDILRITQGALLRLPPGQITRWLVLRDAGKIVPEYLKTVAASRDEVIAPRGANWTSAETVDLDFAVLAAMPGILGLSGDLAGLPAAAQERLTWWVTFHKTWRGRIARAAAHLLTRPRSLGERTGWIALQLEDREEGASLLFVYNLGYAGAGQCLPLQGLSPDTTYTVRRVSPDGSETSELTGAELGQPGLTVSLPVASAERPRACVYCLEPSG